MVVLKEILIHELEGLIKIAFMGDNDLVNKFHESNIGEQECIKETVERIMLASSKISMSFYSVLNGGESIGFLVTTKSNGIPVLYSFGINIQSRTDEILKSFMKSVKHILSGVFMCVLWRKNTRAINFLIKNDMIVFDENDSTTILITQNLIPCLLT